MLVATAASSVAAATEPGPSFSDHVRIMIFLDISGSFVDRNAVVRQGEEIVEIVVPDPLIRLLGVDGEGSAIDSLVEHEFYLFSNQVLSVYSDPMRADESYFSRNAELDKCGVGRGRGDRFCIYLRREFADAANPLFTRIGSALQEAANRASPHDTTIAFIFTDLVDSCLVGTTSEPPRRDCFQVRDRDGNVTDRTISELLRETTRLEMKFVVGEAQGVAQWRAMRSRKVLYHRLGRDLGARASFYLLDRYEWENQEPWLAPFRAQDELSRGLDRAIQVATVRSWGHSGLHFDLSSEVDVHSMVWSCDGRVMGPELDFATSNLDRLKGRRGYRIEQRSCDVPRCREDEELLLRIQTYESIVPPIRAARFAPPCLHQLHLVVREDPELSFGTLPQDFVHGTGSLVASFLAFLGDQNPIGMTLYEFSPEWSLKARMRQGETNSEFGDSRRHRMPRELAKMELDLFGSWRPSHFRCQAWMDDLSRKSYLALTSAAEPRILLDTDRNTSGELTLRDVATKVVVRHVVEARGYVLLLAQVIFLLITMALCFLTFRIVRLFALAPAVALVLAAFPLLVQIHPGAIRAALWTHSWLSHSLSIVGAILVIAHSGALLAVGFRLVPANTGSVNQPNGGHEFAVRFLRCGLHLSAIVLMVYVLSARVDDPGVDGDTMEVRCESEVTGATVSGEVRIEINRKQS